MDGFLALDKTHFAASFAADVSPEKADFMANSLFSLWPQIIVGRPLFSDGWSGEDLIRLN